ncbi:MAG: hypothetical protein ACREEP_07840 [Dongiaceae bacterium]
MPWILIPILPLLTGSIQASDRVQLWSPYLLAPLAAFLGRRYGAHGALTIAIGAIVALLPAFTAGPVQFGGVPAAYAIALWVAVVATADDPLKMLAACHRILSSSFAFVVALLSLPLFFDLGRQSFESGLEISARISLFPLFSFGMFLFGLAGFETRRAAPLLIIAAAAGIAIRGFELDTELANALSNRYAADGSWLGNVRIAYSLDNLAALIMTLAYVSGGRLLGRWREGARGESGVWRHPYLVVAGLIFLSAAGDLSWLLLPQLPPFADLLGIRGEYYALPLAAFMAGFLLGHAGIGYSLGLLVLFAVAGNGASVVGGGSMGYVSLEEPLYCLAYGLLGLRMRDLSDGTSAVFQGKRWFLYAAIVLAILPFVTSLSDLFGVAKAGLIAVGGALLAIAARWVRDKLATNGIMLTAEGWLSLVAIIGIVIAVAANIESLVLGLAEYLFGQDIPLEIGALIILVALHIPLALLALWFGKILPKIRGDVRALVAFARKRTS